MITTTTMSYEERRAQEQAERQKISNRIFEIISQMDWHLVPDKDETYPRHKASNGKTGLTYFFNADQWHAAKQGKVEITAFFEVKTELGERVYSDTRASICLSLAKPIETICKDIRRRLIPDAEKAMAELEERKAQWDDGNKKQFAALERAIGRSLTPDERKGKKIRQNGIDITSDSKGGITVNISYLSGPTALEVIKALRDGGQIK